MTSILDNFFELIDIINLNLNVKLLIFVAFDLICSFLRIILCIYFYSVLLVSLNSFVGILFENLLISHFLLLKLITNPQITFA